MEPITLRLPEDLISELDEEADDVGYSNRSEYIRHLLQHRKDVSTLLSSETRETLAEYENKTESELRDTVDNLRRDLGDTNDRITELEETIEQIQAEMTQIVDSTEQSEVDGTETTETADSSGQSEADSTEAPETVDPSAQSDGTVTKVTNDRPEPAEISAEESTNLDENSELAEWIRTDGPDRQNIKYVLLDAAEILLNQGPLNQEALQSKLFEQHSERYASSDDLWRATFNRWYKHAPGFAEQKDGTYEFRTTKE